MLGTLSLVVLAALTLLPPALAQKRTPVLVELFTSEGCSSCPAADALLARLLHDQPVSGAQIVVFGEHVDYWDGLGWLDRFSSPLYTARQNGYGSRFHLESVYTPQMVVDGSVQFVGNDESQALRSIAAASHADKLPLELTPIAVSGRTFSSIVTMSAPASTQADLFAALIEPMASTDVRRGENQGRVLKHVSVVRTLTRIGDTRDLAHGPLTFSIPAPEGAETAHMQLIVFAQQPNLGPILGVSSIH